MRAIGLSDNDVLDKLRHPEYYQKSIEAANDEGIASEDQALLELYKKLRPGEPPRSSGGQTLLHSRFFDPKRYDLGRVGRYKINKKLRLTIPTPTRTLTPEDVLSTIDYLINLELDVGGATPRRHRPPRQPPRALAWASCCRTQVRVGLNRLERIIKERMTVGETESAHPGPAGEPQAPGGGDQGVLRLQPAEPVHGSDEPAGGAHPQAPHQRPRPRRPHPRARPASPCATSTPPTTAASARSRRRKARTPASSARSPPTPAVNEYGFIETPFWKVENGIVLKQSDPIVPVGRP
jgi:DNA-directed RNA polymerase subunit beta